MDGAPGADTPLNRAANASAKFGMTPDNLIEDGDRSNAGSAFSIGTISASKISASGSERRRSRGAFFCDGSLESFSSR